MTRHLLYSFALAMLACSLPAVGQSAGPPLEYTPLATPCRAVDTRQTSSPIQGGTTRTFSPFAGACNISVPDDDVIVYAVNVTAVPHGHLNYLTVYPAGQAQPVVSLLNSEDGRTKANAAFVAGGTSGNISVFATDTTDFILDVTGYFTSTTTGMVYVPVTPCRIIDTRSGLGGRGTGPASPPQTGPLVATVARTWEIAYPITVDDPVQMANSCNLPYDVGGAYSVNVTVIPVNNQPIWFASAWGASSNIPTGGIVEPPFSNVNAPTGTVTANAAIINGRDLFTAYSDTAADLVVDVTGWFAPANVAPEGLPLFTFPPCRALDTRQSGPKFPGTLQVAFTGHPSAACDIPAAAQSAKAFVLNATVVPPGPLPYLTLWPNGSTQPVVSTLNASDGYISSNMAIVTTGPSTLNANTPAIQAYAPAKTDLLLDAAGYFAANPLTKLPKVVFIGDETTLNWPMADHPNWINKGVAGNTTDQMLARFQTDVIALHPDVVHIMGGAYDAIDENWNYNSQCGPDTCANINAMSEMANAAGIRVVIGTPLDVANMTEDQDIDEEVFSRQLRLNHGAGYLPGYLLDYRRYVGGYASMSQMAEAEVGLAAGSPITEMHFMREIVGPAPR
jgi:hypothetical protein